MMSDAKRGEFPSLLFLIYGSGIVFPAATILLRSGPALSLGAGTAAAVAMTARTSA